MTTRINELSVEYHCASYTSFLNHMGMGHSFQPFALALSVLMEALMLPDAQTSRHE